MERKRFNLAVDKERNIEVQVQQIYKNLSRLETNISLLRLKKTLHTQLLTEDDLFSHALTNRMTFSYMVRTISVTSSSCHKYFKLGEERPFQKLQIVGTATLT